MPVKYDVVATLGSFESNGQTKYINRKVGVILSTQHGFSLKLDSCFTPAGLKSDESGSVWLKLFPPKEFHDQQKQAVQKQLNEPPQHTAHQNPPQQSAAQTYAEHSQGTRHPTQPAPSSDYDDDIPF